MSAGNAGRAGYLLATVPKHARVLHLPIDGESLVDLDILARLHATPAQDALTGIVSIERIGMVLRVGFLKKWARLMFHIQMLSRIVHRAVAVIVVADGAVQVVILQDAVKGLALRGIDTAALGVDGHICADHGSAGAH